MSNIGSAPESAGRTVDSAPPELIIAVPLRRTGRTIAAITLIFLIGLFLYGAATNSTYSWDDFGKYLFDRRISQAAFNTVQLTLFSMAGAIALGVILAVMRLSPNPVLKAVSWVYLWFFHGVPIYVQLVFWGLVATIYKQIDLGIPFVKVFVRIQTESTFSVFQLAIIGLALYEAAYMAEIIRAGITSVDEGQQEAATALGMPWGQTMLRIVLPQAMPVLIPPTGNELISMLKTTSLVAAVPYSFDLYARSRDISAETFNPIPMLFVASAWYLFFSSILMVGQHYLERYFARGSSRKISGRQLRALGKMQSSGIRGFGNRVRMSGIRSRRGGP